MIEGDTRDRTMYLISETWLSFLAVASKEQIYDGLQDPLEIVSTPTESIYHDIHLHAVILIIVSRWHSHTN